MKNKFKQSKKWENADTNANANAGTLGNDDKTLTIKDQQRIRIKIWHSKIWRPKSDAMIGRRCLENDNNKYKTTIKK